MLTMADVGWRLGGCTAQHLQLLNGIAYCAVGRRSSASGGLRGAVFFSWREQVAGGVPAHFFDLGQHHEGSYAPASS